PPARSIRSSRRRLSFRPAPNSAPMVWNWVPAGS
ncbi:uncharacterized protein METZ01_LOCUS48799, partial [marine metagenome]